jgi:hypothetical protein
MSTAYADLSHAEKELDRVQAMEIIALLRTFLGDE